MAQPFKHPRSGVYYFRQKVPADLRAALGDKIVQRSLRTKDPAEAKIRHLEEAQKQAAVWSAHRKGPQPLDLKTTMALCGEVYREWVGAIEAEPGPVTIWATLAEKNAELSAKQGEARRWALESWYGTTADEVLSRHGVLPDVASRDRLLEQIHDTVVRASGTLHRRAEGDYGPDPHESRYPISVSLSTRPEGPSKADEGVTLTSLFREWEKQARADGKPDKTIRDFRHKVDNLVAFLGHGRVRDIAPADVVRWTDHLRDEKGLSGKTIGQKYLAVVRLMFNYAKSRAMGIPDPTDGIVIKAPKRQTTREKGFTDVEARTILSAAKAGVGVSDRMSEAMCRAIRWVPWICAHTGARVTEITQLRKEDVQTIDGIPCLRITPAAGSVKAGSYRLVPVHPQLVSEGLLEAIQSLPSGPIFHGKGVGAAGVSARIGEWVRTHAKITDPDIQPNHAWRHRMKTVCRDHGVADEWADHLQGHANPRAAEGYGERTVKALYREVCKLPDYGVT